MDWLQPIDNYCERVGAGFWAEPLNAVSNGAFLIAAFAALTLMRRQSSRDLPAVLLVGNIAVIGVGSFLFHTFASRWSALADVLPIAVFIHVYLFVALRRFFGAGILLSLLVVAGFAGLSPGLAAFLHPLAGSTAGYAPALLAMTVTGLLLLRKNTLASKHLLSAACIFALSMSLRFLDGRLCAALPFGTHFLWHILNAATLFMLIRALIFCNRKAAKSGASQWAGRGFASDAPNGVSGEN